MMTDERDSSPDRRERQSPDSKKPYDPPVLKKYDPPKLRKHQSYKDITLLFATPVVAVS